MRSVRCFRCGSSDTTRAFLKRSRKRVFDVHIVGDKKKSNAAIGFMEKLNFETAGKM